MHHVGATSAPSIVEWVLVAAAALILVWAVGLASRYTVAPGEREATHIKRRILLDESDEPEEARPR